MHNFWEIVCVLEGEVGVASANDLYTLSKGQAVIHSPMEFHNIWSENLKKTNENNIKINIIKYWLILNKLFSFSF